MSHAIKEISTNCVSFLVTSGHVIDVPCVQTPGKVVYVYTVWLQYFEGLNFRSLRVNPLFGNFRGIYFRCMHYDALSLASDRIASYPSVAVVSLLFSCYHTSTKVPGRLTRGKMMNC